MVNTFVLTNTPESTVKLLDYKRLGKQRVEAKQIIEIIEKSSKLHSLLMKESNTKISWANHPIVAMWCNNLNGLKYYCNACIREWINRGYKNNMTLYSIQEKLEDLPWWFCNIQLQNSHRASLIRKDSIYYKDLSCIPDYINYGYIWINKLPIETQNLMKQGIPINLDLICSQISSSSPAQYRYTKDEVIVWLKCKDINPKTKHKISKTGQIYRELQDLAVYYKLVIKLYIPFKTTI